MRSSLFSEVELNSVEQISASSHQTIKSLHNSDACPTFDVSATTHASVRPVENLSRLLRICRDCQEFVETVKNLLRLSRIC